MVIHTKISQYVGSPFSNTLKGNFRKQSPYKKYEIRNRFSHAVISAWKFPSRICCALFDILQKYKAKAKLNPARASTTHSSEIYPVIFLASIFCGVLTDKRQIASCRFAEYRLPLFDRHAIKRLRINEPGTNISANSLEVDDTSPEFYKERPLLILHCSR